MKILIFIPTYNEKENIGILIDELNKLNFEKDILIVDDNSPDGTIDIVEEKNKEYGNLILIVRKTDRGRGLAGCAGFKYFINSDYDVLVEMDADMSHSPEYIPGFLNKIDEYDVVIGSRLIEGGYEEGRFFLRKYVTFAANSFIRLILGIKIRDCTSGFRVFKKNKIKKLDFDNFISVNPSIVEEILYGCKLLNCRIKEMPILFKDRTKGTSKLNILKLFNTFWTICKIRLRGDKILK